MLPLAHAGHWLVSVLYVLPVLIVLGSIVATALRDRRQRGPDEPGAPSEPDAPAPSGS